MADLTQFNTMQDLASKKAEASAKLTALYNASESRSLTWINSQLIDFAKKHSFEHRVIVNTSGVLRVSLTHNGMQFMLDISKEKYMGIWTQIAVNDPRSKPVKQISVIDVSPRRGTNPASLNLQGEAKIKAEIKEISEAISTFKDPDLEFLYGRSHANPNGLANGPFEDVFAFLLNNPDK